MPKKLENIKNLSHSEWLEMRKRGIGGSDAATCVNMNPYSGLLTLYSRKVGLSSEATDNEAMRLGRDLEQYVADRFMESSGKKVVNDNYFYIDDEYDFLFANIDRRVVGENAGFEAKTMGSFNGYNIEAGEIPSHYYCQCQHYCSVMNWDRIYIGFLVLQRGFYWHCIERDDDFIRTLRSAEVDFWQNYVVPRRMPSPDGGEADIATLKELYPEARRDSEIHISGLDSLVKDYKAFSDLAKDYEEKKERVKSQICARLGTSEVGLGDEVGVSWKNQSKMSIDEKRLKAEKPELYREYSKVSNYRVFRTKKIGGKK